MAIPIFEGSYARPVFQVDGSGNVAPAGSASSPSYTSLVDVAPTALTYQQLAPAASTTLTPGAATRAIISTTGADLRWRIDATLPTASVGNYLPVGKELVIVGATNLANFKCIQATATASVNVQYFA